MHKTCRLSTFVVWRKRVSNVTGGGGGSEGSSKVLRILGEIHSEGQCVQDETATSSSLCWCLTPVSNNREWKMRGIHSLHTLMTKKL